MDSLNSHEFSYEITVKALARESVELLNKSSVRDTQ
jgi:hypothetical protein